MSSQHYQFGASMESQAGYFTMYMSSKLGHIKCLNLHPPKLIPLVVSACLYIGLGMHGFFVTTPFSHCFFSKVLCF